MPPFLYLPFPSPQKIQPPPRSPEIHLLKVMGVDCLVHFLPPSGKSCCPIPCAPECQMSVICVSTLLMALLSQGHSPSFSRLLYVPFLPYPQQGRLLSSEFPQHSEVSYPVHISHIFPHLCICRNTFPTSTGQNPSF